MTDDRQACNVHALPGAMPNDGDSTASFRVFDTKVCAAINEARASGVQQGLVVAALHGYAHSQTALMVEDKHG